MELISGRNHDHFLTFAAVGDPTTYKIIAVGMVIVLALIILGYYQDYKKGKLRN